MKRALVRTLVLSAMLTTSASAERLTGGVTDVTPILNAPAEGRILLRLSLPTLAENVAIRRAILIFDIPAGLEVKRLPLRVYPVTTPWNSATVNWDRGWTRPGGDFPEDLFARAELELGREAGTGMIDLTALVKEVVEDGFASDGLLVTLDPNFGEAIRAADLPRFAILATGRLEISSRVVPPTPREVIEAMDSAR